MSRKTRILVVVAVLIVVSATTLFATGKQQAVDDSSPITFTMLYNESASNPFDPKWPILDVIEQKKNVRLDVQVGPDSDFLTKKNLVFNSGDIPDFVQKNWPNEITDFAASGILLPVSDYYDMLPNWEKLATEWHLDPEIDDLRFADGKVYLMGGFKPYAQQVQQWTIRMDLLRANNLPVPETLDEMLNTLIALKKANPDIAGVTGRWGGQHLLNMLGFDYGTHAGWGEHLFYLHDEKKWVYAPATDEFREMLRYLNRMMAAGVLDPETFTQDTAQYDQKILTGKAVISVDWVPQGMGSLNAQMEAAGIQGADWEPMLPPTTTIGTRAVPPAGRYNVGTVIPTRVASEPYFQRLMSFLDWIYYSPEGITLNNWGIEGVTYEVVNGKKQLLPTIEHWRNPGATVKMNSFGIGMFYMNDDPSWMDYKSPAEISTFLKDVADRGLIPAPQPSLVLDPETQEFVKITETPLNDYVNTAQLQFIYGDLDIEHDWDAYIANLRSRGLAELEKRVNDAMK